MVTGQHVVADEQKVIVRFGVKEAEGQVERVDKDLDLALLRFDNPISGIEPVEIAATCPPDTRWKTYGYPAIAKGLPIPMQGYVMRADGVDSLGKASVVLYADMVQGNGQTVSGLSGSPVMVNGLVVGNIKRILENPDRKGWPLYGLLWATPASDLLKFLGESTARAAEPEKAEVDRLSGVRRELDVSIRAIGVYALWNYLQETGTVDERFSARAAKLPVQSHTNRVSKLHCNERNGCFFRRLNNHGESMVLRVHRSKLSRHIYRFFETLGQGGSGKIFL